MRQWGQLRQTFYDWTMQRRIALLLTGAMITFLLCVLLLYFSISGALQDGYRALDTLTAVQMHVNGMEVALIDEETGERGYALTGQSVFLQPYVSGKRAFARESQMLSKDTATSPAVHREIMLAITQGRLWEQNFGSVLVKRKRRNESVYLHAKYAFDGFRNLVALARSQLLVRELQLRSELSTRLSQILRGLFAATLLFGLAVILSVTRELTLRARTQALLMRSQKLATVGQLAASVAHEIRNPLTVLKGFVQLLEETKDPRDASRYLGIMRDELRRIELISGEMLVLAKPEADVLAAIDLPSVVAGAVDEVRQMAQQCHISVSTALDDGRFDRHVLGDEDKLTRALVNVLQNAIEAMPTGGQLGVTLQAEPDGITIVVADTGRGMSADTIARLGEPFYSTKDKGTGLGLMVAYKIVEMHHGHVDVVSEEGRGTRVRIWLPRVQEGIA